MLNKSEKTMIIISNQTEGTKKKFLSHNLKVKILIACIFVALIAAFFIASIVAITIMIIAFVWIVGNIIFNAIQRKFRKTSYMDNPSNKIDNFN